MSTPETTRLYRETFQFMDAVLEDTLRDGTTFSGGFPGLGRYRFRFILRVTDGGSTITLRDLDADTAEGWEDTTRGASMDNIMALFKAARAALDAYTMATPPAKGYARPVAVSSPHVRDGVLWLTWRGEYILTSSVDHYVHETMAFPSNPTATVLDWAELAVVGPHDHTGCIRTAGYIPTPAY